MTPADAADGAGKIRPLSVCLINPRYEPSFWGYDFALPLQPGDKRCWMVSGSLPTLAALAPSHCSVELIDENVEPINFDDLDRFDVIGVTGMVVQNKRMQQILKRLRGSKAKIVVGGPYISVAESQFVDLCDTRFIGEAEETWPAYLIALGRGEQVPDRYEQPAKTNMETVPAPRYDLIKSEHYVMASLQFSRGCPFLCEFCDIITIFGRRPRLKTIPQMIDEIETIREAGFNSCFLVDDNFIGNKVKAKELLKAIRAWQIENGYPIQFSTEASINLADDAEMISLMVEANVLQVFVGIETPRTSSLAEIQKIQNIRGDSQLDKIQRIRDGGLLVTAGFMVGFDNDDEKIFEEQYDFIQKSGIALSIVSLLTPVPTTPLYDRFEAEGRLDFSDPDVIFHPKKMSRETLKRGYADLTQRLYEPRKYFERLFAGYAGSPEFRRIRREHFAKFRKDDIRGRLAQTASGIVRSVGLARTLRRERLLGKLGRAYLDAWLNLNRPLGPESISLTGFVGLCEVHWHLYNIASGPRRGAFGAVLPQDTVLFDEARLPKEHKAPARYAAKPAPTASIEM